MNSMTLLHHFESAGQAQLYISWFMVLKPWNILRRTFAAIAPSSGNDLTNFSQKLLFPYAWEGDDKRWLFQKAFICWNNLFRLYGWPILILFFVFTILKPSYVHMYTSLSMGKGIYILNMPICQAPKGLQNWRIKATRGLVLINWCAAFRKYKWYRQVLHYSYLHLRATCSPDPFGKPFRNYYWVANIFQEILIVS